MKNLFKTGLCLVLLFWVTFQCVAQNNIVKRLAWEGRIGQNIPVKVWLEINSDGLAAGELVYTKTGSGKPIVLIGEYNAEYGILNVSEYRSDGFITGNIHGTIKGNKFVDGSWEIYKKRATDPAREVQYPMVLDKPIAFPKGVNSYLRPSKESEVAGAYTYSHIREYNGEHGGDMCVRLVGDSVVFRITVCDPNLASVSSDIVKNPVKLVGNKFATTVLEQDEDNPSSWHDVCKFETLFFPKFAYIRMVKPTEVGYFGLNTDIEGIYFKETVNIDYASERDLSLAKKGTYKEVVIDKTEYQRSCVLTTSATVTNLRIVQLSNPIFDKNDNVVYKYKECFRMETFTPEMPLLLKFSFPADWPPIAIIYVDENGKEQTKGVHESMEDGSLSLRPDTLVK